MLKYLILILICACIINTAKGERADTIISYYKYDLNGYHKVGMLDSADFFLAVLPPDSADDKVNIQEYYKSGKIKFIGKSATPINATFLPNGVILSGNCVSYYPNGKKRSIAHYTDGIKEGAEYVFYPNGAVYSYKKYIIKHGDYRTRALFLECYDKNGNMICKDGNGEWIMYDTELNKVSIIGQVKDGYMDGDWHGRSLGPDSIKYVYKYNLGIVVSSTGYDKDGKPYPFNLEAEWADYKGGAIVFIQIFKNHLTLPRDSNGEKMRVDTMHISFTIEKDGHPTGLKVLGDKKPELRDALAEALSKCHDWTPSRIYGVPLRTEIILPLGFVGGFVGNTWVYREEIFFKRRIIGY